MYTENSLILVSLQMSPFTFVMCERIRFKFEMMADSDFENFIMKMTIRIMTRKTEGIRKSTFYRNGDSC